VTDAATIVRAAIPDASDELVDHVLWARTPFPVGRVTAQDLYKAASQFGRAMAHQIDLCEFCHNALKPGEDKWTCPRCTAALDPKRFTSSAGDKHD
jgi:uncharacterized paraquat-inducible protein A